MPKHDFLTPKAIGNRIKSKGLQKLRWFCQMCSKQCRDENGFKCHCLSESHARQMSIFSSNPGSFMNEYSRDFERGFMQIVRVRGKRIKANTVYQAYISEPQHVHMNSTIWSTLSSFVQYLGKTGQCIVDKGEKHWYLKYIDRDPRTVARQAATVRKEKLALDDEERNLKMIEHQILLANRASDRPDEEDKEIVSDFNMAERSVDAKIGFSFREPTDESNQTPVLDVNDGLDASDSAGSKRKLPTSSSSRDSAVSLSLNSKRSKTDIESRRPKSKKKYSSAESVLDSLMSEDRERAERKRFHEERQNSRKRDRFSSSNESGPKKSKKADHIRKNWIQDGLIVKIVNEKFMAGRFHNKKGTIIKVHDSFVAEITLLKTRETIKIDQNYCETVIPSYGKPIQIVNGEYCGLRGTLESIDQESFSASVKLSNRKQSDDKNRIISDLEYVHICKFDPEFSPR
uniref:DNA/RNA-binding protein KIN17 n=1 Tax=Hirondellea gigas TaxID=1518452 RepID=A0A6A7GAZ4_9CRUS